MRNLWAKSILVIFLMFAFLCSKGQIPNNQSVEFKNAPIRFKENNRSFQQVIVNYKADNQGAILVSYEGKEVVKADLKKGNNSFLITLPAVQKEKKVNFMMTINGGKPLNINFIVKPPQKWDIYLVQHSHTDIGYTRPQSEILAEHQRYMDYALDYCDMTDHFPEDARFRWTCESAWVVKEYLKTRPMAQIERLRKRIAEGRIEVTGMFCNMAETADENLMTDFLRPLQIIQEAGFPVKTVMQNDVNGIAYEPAHTSVSNVTIEKGTNGNVWESIKIWMGRAKQLSNPDFSCRHILHPFYSL